jgi:hypothetical protein
MDEPPSYPHRSAETRASDVPYSHRHYTVIVYTFAAAFSIACTFSGVLASA